MPLVFALSAAERSGDVLGAGLMRAIRRRAPDAEFFGAGGELMLSEGLEQKAQLPAVMGFGPVAAALWPLWRARQNLLTALRNRRPALFIGVDMPDFNLSLARAARASGIAAAQYGSPSVWIWRPRRAAQVAAAVREVWCLYPFELACYENEKVTARFVGHPAADLDSFSKEEARAALGIAQRENDERKIVALFPGSRRQELRAHLPLLREAVKEIEKRERCLFIAAAVNEADAEEIKRALPAVKIFISQSAQTLAAADAALVKSGTIALEGALAQTPMAVFYKPGAVDSFIVRRRQWQGEHFSLPNILCGRAVLPELMLDAATPKSLAAAALRLLKDEAAREQQREQFRALRDMLKKDSFERAAEAALNLAEAAEK